MIVILGDVNAKSSTWYKHDKRTYESSKFNRIKFQFGLQQLIQGPTQILSNSSSSADLIFTFEPNLVMESGFYASIHENCHHQLVYAKFNLKCGILDLMNARYSIINMGMLIRSREQLNNIHGKYY